MDEKWKEKAKDIIAWQVIHDAGNLAETMKKDIAAALAEAHAEGVRDGVEYEWKEIRSWKPYLHWCADWDFLLIDETDGEFDHCNCFGDKKPKPRPVEAYRVALKDAPEGK